MSTEDHRPKETNRVSAWWLARRRAQFVFATLGIVLLVPLFVALMVLIPFLNERRVARQIESLGGTVSYEYFGPEWLTPTLRTQFTLFDRITIVNLNRTKNTDRALPGLGLLKQLQTLDLESSDVSDAGLRSLERLSHLRGLGLNRTSITDDGVTHLRPLTGLQGLHLDGTKITDAGVKHLQAMTHLQLLAMSNTLVSDAGIDAFFEMHELQSLNLAESRVTRRGFASLRQALPNCELPVRFDPLIPRDEF